MNRKERDVNKVKMREMQTREEEAEEQAGRGESYGRRSSR